MGIPVNDWADARVTEFVKQHPDDAAYQVEANQNGQHSLTLTLIFKPKDQQAAIVGKTPTK